MTDETKVLSAEREAEIRHELANWCFGAEAGDRIKDLLAEIDRLREQPATQAPVPTRESIADELQALMHKHNSVPEEPRRLWLNVPEFERDDWRGLADFVLSLLAKHASAPVQVTEEEWDRVEGPPAFEDISGRDWQALRRALNAVIAKRSPEPAQAVTITREHADAIYAEWYRGQKAWDGGGSAEMAMHRALAIVFGSSAVQVPTFDREALLAKIDVLSAEVTAAGERIADRIDNEIVNPLRAQLEAANKRCKELEAQLASLREACTWRGGLDAVVADLRSDKPYPHPQVAVYMERVKAALDAAPPQQPAEVAKPEAPHTQPVVDPGPLERIKARLDDLGIAVRSLQAWSHKPMPVVGTQEFDDLKAQVERHERALRYTLSALKTGSWASTVDGETEALEGKL